jgi:hypothetical protein
MRMYGFPERKHSTSQIICTISNNFMTYVRNKWFENKTHMDNPKAVFHRRNHICKHAEQSTPSGHTYPLCCAQYRCKMNNTYIAATHQ